MPELPEVETVRRGLEPIIDHTIVACDVRRRDVIRDRCADLSNPRRGRIEPGSLGIGSRVIGLERHGKQLALALRRGGAPGRFIVIQLGMSGQVSLVDTPRIPDAKHVHVVWTLDDGRRVCFRDARRFGGVTLLPDRSTLESCWSSLGPDALTISGEQLRHTLKSSTRAIKAALLDQAVLAGVGNIYADEALHRAGIDPCTPCHALSGEQVISLTRCTREVLDAAVRARGSTLRDYRDPSANPGEAQHLHRVYARAGEACLTCGTTIRSTQVAQRTTCWCPACQR
jgi:formamidopyrimidine-DNA glycosylase